MNRIVGRATVGPLLAVVLAAGIFAGCSMVRLKDELLALNRDYLVVGRIINAPEFEAEIIVVLVRRDDDGGIVAADVGGVGNLGDFAFMVDQPERQYVLAFADTDGDKKYQPGEPAWIHTDASGELIEIEFLEPQRRAWLAGHLHADLVVPQHLVDEGRAFRGDRALEEVVTGWSIPVAAGEIADLDDDRFSAKRGEKGLWEPVSFPMKTGVGIFFLEPYAADRIPVLFVYGAGGSPQHFRTIFETMDRERFQPWFFQYPTGRRLGEIAEWLNIAVRELRNFYEFDRMAVVAHSMGGLVSRAFLNLHAADASSDYVDLFVTISTPWAGHEQAKAGVERSPVVVPAWHDLASGSDFLGSLFDVDAERLPPHHLFFSYRGKSSMILPSSNDGTVSVASQLRPEAQAKAVRVYGFDAGHVEVLSAEPVLAKLNQLLSEAF